MNNGNLYSSEQLFIKHVHLVINNFISLLIISNLINISFICLLAVLGSSEILKVGDALSYVFLI